MKTFPIECINTKQTYVKVKRFDGLFYNSFSQKFEDDPNLYFNLTAGEGAEKNLWTAQPSVELTDEFPAGRYTIYYYDVRGLRFAFYESVVNENSPTEIARRVAEIQIGETTLRSTLNEILKILKSKDSTIQ